MEMMDREMVISALDCRANNTDLYCSICEYFRKNADDKIPFCDFESILNDAIALLKELKDEKKRIMKVIWDTLHEGLSIDTVADQDWVYERIRHRIEDA